MGLRFVDPPGFGAATTPPALGTGNGTAVGNGYGTKTVCAPPGPPAGGAGPGERGGARGPGGRRRSRLAVGGQGLVGLVDRGAEAGAVEAAERRVVEAAVRIA